MSDNEPHELYQWEGQRSQHVSLNDGSGLGRWRRRFLGTNGKKIWRHKHTKRLLIYSSYNIYSIHWRTCAHYTLIGTIKVTVYVCVHYQLSPMMNVSQIACLQSDLPAGSSSLSVSHLLQMKLWSAGNRRSAHFLTRCSFSLDDLSLIRVNARSCQKRLHVTL